MTLTQPDLRRNYGEQRFTTAGWLDGRIVVLFWTPRGEDRRIISMRKANDRETKKIAAHLG
ncbi:BrnT family toxin [Caballeronia sp. 15715]|uniref:BrnT family toxin n=1 Tax=unclassified Caballeronia TaxID=2646786 RepID=UPI0039E308C6